MNASTRTNAGGRNPWLALVVLGLGFFMILLDGAIVNVAVPTMVASLHATLDQILWVLNAYLLVFAALLITAGRIGDIVGPRTMFMAGLAIFTLASVLCGLSQDANQLIAARVLQGVGAATMSPQVLVIVAAIFPADRRGAALGVVASITALAVVGGPTLGGLLVTHVGWRWIFYINFPVGVVGLVASFVLVPDFRPGRRHRLDLVGVVLASLGLAGIAYGLIEGQRYDWSTIDGTLVTIPEVIGGGVLLLVAFSLWQRTRQEPLVPLSLFANRGYVVATWLGALSYFGTLGFGLVFTIYFQSVLGMSALSAGLTTLPFAFSLAVGAPIAGRVTDRIGGRYVLMLGSLLYGIGLVSFALVSSTTATWPTFALPFIVAGVGMAFLTAPSMTVALRDIKPAMTGAASGLFNTGRQVGGAIGAAVVGAVLQNRLVSAMHDNAVADSGLLPAGLRANFINSFASAAHSGLEVGRGQSGGAQIPGGVSPALAQQLQGLIHDVFVNSFLTALRPALFVPAFAFAIGALTCLLIAGRHSVVSAPVATHPTTEPAPPERASVEKRA